MIRAERDQQGEAGDGERQRRNLGQPPPRQGAQRRRGKATGLDGNRHDAFSSSGVLRAAAEVYPGRPNSSSKKYL